MDATKFLEALDEIEATKGISKQSILDALRESLRKAYVKSLGGGDDADVRIEIDQNSGKIEMRLFKKVVDEVNDDYLEISLEDAKKSNKKLKVGDEWSEEVPIEEMARLTALTVKSVLKQKLAEASKLALYEAHKDKIGEMITGIVEKCDDRGAIVNINRSSIYLSRKDLIGDETFEANAPIRLYVSDATNSEKGPMVSVSRSDAGFLKRLFEEEVREIYDGTVIIKGIARDAGIRSKIAVYSNNPNVDCVGACIGINGSAIQKIVGQLGNSRDKEKIDIISYSPNDALFIIDALRPATVTHIYLDNENKKAIAVVPDGQLSLAIGRKGANARVACRLTGYHIDIKEENEIPNLDVELKSVEQVKEEEKDRAQKEKYEKYLSQVKAARAKEAEEAAMSTGIEKAKPQQIHDDFLKEEEPVKAESVKEEAPAKESVEVKEEAPTEPTKVRTTTTLESLEKALESDKKKESFKATQKTSKRPRKITEDEIENEEKQPVEEVTKKAPQMEIYTKEELEALDDEENLYEEDYEEEDIDYDDFDKYYDDEN